jgi:hypothetical protein
VRGCCGDPAARPYPDGVGRRQGGGGDAVAVLEQHGPVVTEALRQLDQATTAAWDAVRLVGPTDDEWRFLQRATGIDRGWEAAYRLVSTLDPPGRGRGAE